MTDTTPTGTPREDWTLDQLGEFARQVAKRSAHDAWKLGRAYTIAKAKAKAEGQKIEAWRKRWVPFLSQPTLSRYEAVGGLPEKDVLGRGITEVYRMLGLAPQMPAATPNGTDEDTTAPTSPSVGPEALAGNPLAAQPSEPDSLLKRVATVATLVRSLVNNVPVLAARADDAAVLDEAIQDAIDLLTKLRAAVVRKEAA